MADSGALGKLIRTSRLDKGISLGQLASAIGRSSTSVRRWERGESAPSADVLGSLAMTLDLNEAELEDMVASVHPPKTKNETDPTSKGGGGETSSFPSAAPKVRTTIEDDNPFADFERLDGAVDQSEPPPVQAQPSRYQRASSAVWGRRDSWIGWVRGFFTALALLFLFMGLIWALGELLTALKDLLGTFSTGA